MAGLPGAGERPPHCSPRCDAPRRRRSAQLAPGAPRRRAPARAGLLSAAQAAHKLDPLLAHGVAACEQRVDDAVQLVVAPVRLRGADRWGRARRLGRAGGALLAHCCGLMRRSGSAVGGLSSRAGPNWRMTDQAAPRPGGGVGARGGASTPCSGARVPPCTVIFIKSHRD